MQKCELPEAGPSSVLFSAPCPACEGGNESVNLGLSSDWRHGSPSELPVLAALFPEPTTPSSWVFTLILLKHVLQWLPDSGLRGADFVKPHVSEISSCHPHADWWGGGGSGPACCSRGSGTPPQAPFPAGWGGTWRGGGLARTATLRRGGQSSGPQPNPTG